MKEGVYLKDGILRIYEGDGYYDTDISYELDKVVRVKEEVGVKGGHIGWSIYHKKLDGGEWVVREDQMGRKSKRLMKELQGLVTEKKLDIELDVEKGVVARCY